MYCMYSTVLRCLTRLLRGDKRPFLHRTHFTLILEWVFLRGAFCSIKTSNLRTIKPLFFFSYVLICIYFCFPYSGSQPVA